MLKPLLAVMILSMTLSMAAAADSLSIAEPTYTTPNTEKNGVNRPVRGMTMKQVEQRYGKAEQQYTAVGTPAITRWQYGLFDVYFEDQLVIHSVVRRSNN